jgi:hypothetical protein
LIVEAVVMPHPPVLLPGLTGRPVTEVEALRAAATSAIAAALDTEHAAVVAVGGADETATWPARPIGSSLFLGERADGTPLPLSLSVIRALLGGDHPAEWRSVAFDAAPAEAAALGRELAARPERTVLLVAGDGSARRGPKAPGYEDPRAQPFDAGVRAALAAADTAALAALDPSLAAELLAAGRAAWQVLAAACADGGYEAVIDYADDPFGVQYTVARWARRDRAPAPAQPSTR